MRKIFTKKIYLAFAFLFFFLLSNNLLTAQDQGKVVFIGFNADGDDGFSILTLVDLLANDRLFFTDREWDGTQFNTGEGELVWENTTGSTISAGTIITFAPVVGTGPTVSIGTVTESGSFSISASDEAIWILNVSSTVANDAADFISVISNEDDNPPVSAPDLSNTGLVNGVTAVLIDGDEDVMTYDGANGTDCTGLSLTDCATLFNTVSSWITEDGSGDQSQNTIAPDYPDDVILSATIPSTYGFLPIALIHFEATKKGNTIALNWQTANELNNDYMAIERSQDGRIFEEIGRVQGAGTTNKPQHYYFIDEQPLNGINYYRLRQVDFNGKAEFHRVVSVELANSAVIRISPNPVNNFTYLQLDEAFDEDAPVLIYDFTGRPVFKTQLAAGAVQLNLDLSFLSKGNYIIRVENVSYVFTERFLKQ